MTALAGAHAARAVSRHPHVAIADPGGASDLRKTRTAAVSAPSASDHLRIVFPGIMLVALAGLVVLTLRQQSRPRPV